MWGRKTLKEGDVVMNRQHPDPVANRHLLLQTDKQTAVILTSKQFPADNSETMRIQAKEKRGIIGNTDTFATDNVVNNTAGKIKGQVSPRETKRVKRWLNL